MEYKNIEYYVFEEWSGYDAGGMNHHEFTVQELQEFLQNGAKGKTVAEAQEWLKNLHIIQGDKVTPELEAVLVEPKIKVPR